eukprot:PLAT3354.30.p1 GENE.PLAT3354.30~~PLAT3354.30.p1  ORF type:complete len:388 (-),score=90.55 PLAT3354.30:80-1084(-)
MDEEEEEEEDKLTGKTAAAHPSSLPAEKEESKEETPAEATLLLQLQSEAGLPLLIHSAASRVPRECLLRLQSDRLQWRGQHGGHTSSMRLADIASIQLGQSTASFRDAWEDDADCCVSLCGVAGTLDLQFAAAAQRDEAVRCFASLLNIKPCGLRIATDDDTLSTHLASMLHAGMRAVWHDQSGPAVVVTLTLSEDLSCLLWQSRSLPLASLCQLRPGCSTPLLYSSARSSAAHQCMTLRTEEGSADLSVELPSTMERDALLNGLAQRLRMQFRPDGIAYAGGGERGLLERSDSISSVFSDIGEDVGDDEEGSEGDDEDDLLDIDLDDDLDFDF